MKIKNIIKRVAVLSGIVALSFCHVFAQNGVQDNSFETKMEFRYPLDVPMSLSGNYGELRSNHFHNGIDFRVGGVVGAPIYATEQGYISRVTVSASGYGNAIYIMHPNGYLSVYGHMHCFADRIADFVREKQYADESFVQDISFTPEQFPVKKGDYIGKAGNTGSSGGPHLHFEIRDENNNPTNPFGRGYLKIKDNMPPVFNNVLFYGFDYVNWVPDSYYIGMPKNGIINLPQHSYVCIDAVDKQEGTNAKLAVNDYKVYLDTTLIYHFSLGEVPMDWGRDINSLMEFKQKVVRGKSYVKSYVDPGNLLRDRIKGDNFGIITLNDTLKHKVRIEVADVNNNRAVRSYVVKRADSLFAAVQRDSVVAKGAYAAWFLPNFHNADGFDVFIPQGVLYNSISLHVDSLPQRVTPYAPVWNVASDRIALRSAVTVSIKGNVPDSLAGKAFVAFVYNGGKLGYAGGKYDPASGVFEAKVLSLGKFTVATDTEAPSVVPAFANNSVVKGESVVFRMRDNLSGIKSYRVEIDGHWVLAEHDAKTRRVIVPLKYAKIAKGKRHEAVFVAEDNCGNVTRVKRVFTW